jgi:hypothetical protein
VEAANLTDHPVRIIKARIIRPKPKGILVHGEVMLPAEGSPYHSDKHAVPPRDTATASLHIMARGALVRKGKTLRATIGITDQFGQEYRLKRLVIPTNDTPLEKIPLKKRIPSLLSSIRQILKSREQIEAAVPLPVDWQHGGRFDAVDLVLNEEKRAYAANNRKRGGLGSLNVTLQSEPNNGWSEVGKVPDLLWTKEKAKTISSPNLDRLLRIHDSLAKSEKEALERYLISHLNRKSLYFNIGYFIFSALHRMGKTESALVVARANLSGDAEFGYSNLLGILSALVSHEHHTIPDELFVAIMKVLEADKESSFRLAEKITLARLQHINAAHA